MKTLKKYLNLNKMKHSIINLALIVTLFGLFWSGCKNPGPVELFDEQDDSKLIEGQTLSLSAATLQENVKTIITGKGGTISSERVDKPEDLSGFKVITISIDSVLPDTRVLSDILYAIETRTPHFIVKEVDVRVRNFREPRELMVKLRVSALTIGR